MKSSNASAVYIDFLSFSGDVLKIEGYADHVDKSGALYIVTTKDRRQVRFTERHQAMVNWRKEAVDRHSAFVCEITTSPRDDLQFVLSNGEALRIYTNQFTRIAPISFAYRIDQNNLVRKFRSKLTIRPNTRGRRIGYEISFTVRLLAHWRFDRVRLVLRRVSPKSLVKAAAIIGENILFLPRDYLLRILARHRQQHKKRPIWILSDRAMAAGDNAEALFRYIMSLPDVPVDIYFAISRKSRDYDRMKEVGPVLTYGSFSYKLLFLASDKVISSHADVEVTNPFLRQSNHVVDMYNFDFVFLQHGITKDDVSSWLNRFEKNIKLFITAGRPEYDSILSHPYYYKKENVLLSGFPRYDALKNNPKKKLIIAPTYRANLLHANTTKSGTRPYDTEFRHTEYFAFYDALLHDRRIQDALKQHRMTAELYLHPNFAAQIGDFEGSEVVSIASYPYDYRTAICEGSLLVTDYSSVAFDFAYLKKPVVYSQFDRESFFANHVYTEGYFNYEDDGFGPVCLDYESTIREIIECIRSNAVQDKNYTDRVEHFFKYTDENNSQRVYEELLKEV